MMTMDLNCFQKESREEAESKERWVYKTGQ